MAEPAHGLAGIAVVVRMASVRRVQAQFPAIVQRTDVLVHGVHRLQDAAREFLELAQLHRLVHAIVFQIIDPVDRFEHRLAARHRQPIHVRQFALGRPVVVVGRPARLRIALDAVSRVSFTDSRRPPPLVLYFPRAR